MASKSATAPVESKAHVKAFEKALKLVGSKKYSQAEPILNELLEDTELYPRLAAQVLMYHKICGRHGTGTAAFEETAESLYDYGVIHHNEGRHDDALNLFEKALKKAKGPTDHIAYAMAASSAQAGQEEAALKSLGEAIAADSGWRFRARQDRDFADLADNQGFDDLLKSDDD